jgi:hypothetical protein
MKRNRNFSILVLWFFAFIILFSAAPPLAVAEVSVTGTVYADDWDDKGNVALVVVETADGEIYYVSGDATGKELFKLVEKKVRVSGTVEDTGDEKVITVKKYEILK